MMSGLGHGWFIWCHGTRTSGLGFEEMETRWRMKKPVTQGGVPKASSTMFDMSLTLYLIKLVAPKP